MAWAGNIECIEEKKNSYSILLENPEGQGPIGGNRRRCEGIKIDLK
jgi:hypothetical protein